MKIVTTDRFWIFPIYILLLSCIISFSKGAEEAEKEFTLRRKFDYGHKSVTVKLGEKLHIFCDLTELNETDVTVTWFKDDEPLDLTSEPNNTQIYSSLSFAYEKAEAHHRGWYTCNALRKDDDDDVRVNIGDNKTVTNKDAKFTYYVRVKKGNLWISPMITIGGVCLVLGIILFVYERIRNKDELEDSDESDAEPDSQSRKSKTN